MRRGFPGESTRSSRQTAGTRTAARPEDPARDASLDPRSSAMRTLDPRASAAINILNPYSAYSPARFRVNPGHTSLLDAAQHAYRSLNDPLQVSMNQTKRRILHPSHVPQPQPTLSVLLQRLPTL